MTLTVLVPVYNEEANVAEVIRRVKSNPGVAQIIVVDDNSTDRTPDILSSLTGITVLRHERNRGKGAGIRTGLSHATGDVVIVQDADLEYDPAQYVRLLAPLKDPAVDAVYGSRFRGGGDFLLASRLANYFLTFLTNVLFGGRLTDMETCYKAVRRPLLQGLDLTSERFDVEPEITAKLLRVGARIAEVPIRYRARREGKKIGPMDGMQACLSLVKWYAK